MDLTVNGKDPATTGRRYHTDKVTLIGKTGTAQYIGENGKYTSGSRSIKSFAGVFPKENPKYIIYISVKDYKGTANDLPNITKSVVESIAKYKNIEDRETDIDKSKIIKIENYINNKKEIAIKKLEINNIILVKLKENNY